MLVLYGTISQLGRFLLLLDIKCQSPLCLVLGLVTFCA
jgi:hypothetical protein